MLQKQRNQGICKENCFMLAQSKKISAPSNAVHQGSLPKKDHSYFVILAFLTCFFMCMSFSSHQARANSFAANNTPGMFMAKIEFTLNNPEENSAVSPQQIRLEVMNAKGKELMYVKSPFGEFDPEAGLPYTIEEKP